MIKKNPFAQTEEKEVCSRRSLLKNAGFGLAGLSLAGMVDASVQDQVAYATQNVNRSSKPTELRITDMRVAVLARAPFRSPIIRLDTNQGIFGYGEVRDNADEQYALMLKSRILNMNPCNVEMIFKKIKQFGHHARQGGGVSAVEMACWDLAGKAYGIPVYQMLGGKYRDKIRLYADTGGSAGADGIKRRLEQGFTFLKYDLGINRIQKTPDTLTYPTNVDFRGEHPFTAIQLTDKGLKMMGELFGEVRSQVGWQIPIASDHFGHMSVNDCIKLAHALQPYQPAWLEDMVPWQYKEMLKEIKNSIDVPLLTGEDIYLLDGFKPLIDERAVDMVQPDLATAGGILETKKIGDYAQQAGIAMPLHAACAPITFFANVHCAAATENFVAMEHHAVDMKNWEDLAVGVEKPINNKGYVTVPEGPGLGVDMNIDLMKEGLEKGQELFAPTPEWDRPVRNDRLWSFEKSANDLSRA